MKYNENYTLGVKAPDGDIFEFIKSSAQEISTEAFSIIAEETGVSVERITDLVKAEKDGRLIEPPCKVGDKVALYTESWGNVWNYNTFYKNGKHYVSGEIVSIIKTKKQLLMKIRAEHNVSWKRPTKRYPVSALGKTVFLAREEAESALKERENDGL